MQRCMQSTHAIAAVATLQIGRVLKDESLEVVRELQCDPDWDKKDPEHVALLCQETIKVSGMFELAIL